MSSRRYAVAQRLAQDALLSIYDVDLARYGGGILRWTPGNLASPNSNTIWNSCCGKSASGWAYGGAATLSVPIASTSQFNLPAYKLNEWGSGTVRFAQQGLAAGTYGDLVWGGYGRSAGLVCGPGQWVQAQIAVLPVRCKVTLLLAFFNGDAALPFVTGSSYETISDPGSGGDLRQYAPLFVQAAAPANTTHATLVARIEPLANPSPDSFIIFSRAALAFTNGPTSEPLAWGPGSQVGPLAFGGVTYSPMPIEIEGIQNAASGPQAQPKVTLSDIGSFATQLLLAYNSLLGCKVSRRLVYRRFLDDGTEADPSEYFGPEVYYVNRIASHVPGEYITLELLSPLDIQGSRLPGRQVIRDVCTHTYRAWNATRQAFVQGSCPFAGSAYFAADGSAAFEPAKDVCGRRILDCSARYPGLPLPSRAFPGISQFATS